MAKTCSYVARGVDPANWWGDDPEDFKLYRKQWECPHDTLPGYDRCVFHLDPDEVPEDVDEGDEFVTVINEKSAEAEGERAKQLKEFVGATFGEFVVRDVVLDAGDDHRICFYNCEFRDGVTFAGEAALGSSEFSPAAIGRPFRFHARVDGRCDFRGVTFDADADFRESEFRGDASFHRAEFGADCDFCGTDFGGDAGFYATVFDEAADFGEVVCDGSADFQKAAFDGDATFRGAAIAGDIRLPRARFASAAAFADATVAGSGDLREAVFSGEFDFRRVEFGGRADVRDAVFGGDAQFTSTEFGRWTDFRDAEFGGGIDFRDVRFQAGGDFRQCILVGCSFVDAALVGVAFHKADLTDSDLQGADLRDAGLENVKLSRSNLFDADFRGARFHGATFGEARINDETRFSDRVPYDPYADLEIDGAVDTARTRVARYLPVTRWLPEFPEDGPVGGPGGAAGLADGGIEGAVPDRTARESRTNRLGRAAATYQSIETLARANAATRLQTRAFVQRQEMKRLNALHQSEYARWTRATVARLTLLYGESPWRIIGISLLTVALCAAVYPFGGFRSAGADGPIEVATLGDWLAVLPDSVYFSTLTFTTLGFGDFQPTNWGKTLVTIETAVGAVLMALLVFVLGRRAAR